jgi:hypothetical protein
MDVVEKRKIFCLCWASDPDSFFIQPIALVTVLTELTPWN